MTFADVKKQEGRSRMTAMRLGRRGRKKAAELQRRASLVGDATWRIINLKRVARAMAGWVRT